MRDDKHKVHIYNEVLDKQSTSKPTKGSKYYENIIICERNYIKSSHNSLFLVRFTVIIVYGIRIICQHNQSWHD